MVFKEILVPYDGSSFANFAFNRALDVAQLHNSKVTVITIIKEGYPPIVGFSKMKPKLMQAHRRDARKQITSLEKMASKRGIPFFYKIKQGTSIVKEIINFTKTRKFDLIVMGSHGKTGFKRIMLGSVVNGVVHHTRCPTLIIR